MAVWTELSCLHAAARQTSGFWIIINTKCFRAGETRKTWADGAEPPQLGHLVHCWGGSFSHWWLRCFPADGHGWSENQTRRSGEVRIKPPRSQSVTSRTQNPSSEATHQPGAPNQQQAWNVTFLTPQIFNCVLESQLSNFIVLSLFILILIGTLNIMMQLRTELL